MNRINNSKASKPFFNILWGVFISFLFSVFIAFVVFPLFVRLNPITSFLQINDIYLLLGLLSAITAGLLCSWRKVNIFFQRYKKTYEIINSKFTQIDAAFGVTIISFLLIVVFYHSWPPISSEVSIFFRTLFYTIILYIITAYYYKKNQPKKFHLHKVDDISDEPIKSYNEDLLNRGPFIHGLFEEIQNLNITDSFVFGLYGNWGDGKSSILNLLIREINDEGNFIVVSYNPWNFKDDEAMINGFFNALENAFNKIYIFPNLKKIIINYQSLITSGLSKIGLPINFNLKGNSIEEEREKIENYITNTNKKLIIIIDEIDRLEKNELKMIFKLVRSNSKFKNSIFLLSLDNNQVKKVLETDNDDGLLQKTIQKQILLPKIQPYFIEKFLLYSEHKIPRFTISELNSQELNEVVSTYGFIKLIDDNKIVICEDINSNIHISIYGENLRKIISNFNVGDKIFVEGKLTKNGIKLENSYSRISSFNLCKVDTLLEHMLRNHIITPEKIAFFDKNYTSIYRTQLSKIIINLRSAKLYLNSLYSSYPAIALEVNAFDFFVLEIIKVFHKKLYDDIFENWWFYVNERFENDYLNNPFTLRFATDTDRKQKSIQDHLTNFFESNNIKGEKMEMWREILGSIFPNIHNLRIITDTDRHEKRIFTTSFIKYFTLNVAPNELSDTYFEDIITSWNQKPSAITIWSIFLKLQKINKLYEFLNKLNNIYIDLLNNKTINVLLLTFAKKIKYLSRRTNNLWDSEYESAIRFILKVLDSKVDSSLIQQTIENLIKNTPDLLLAVDLVLQTKKERGGNIFTVYDNTNNYKLRQIVSNKLKKSFIDNKKNIFKEYKENKDWIRILYQWSSNWNDINSPNKTKVSSYISSLLKNNPKLLYELINSFNKGFPNEWNMNTAEINKIYDLKTIASLTRQLKNHKSLRKDQKQIFEKFINIYNNNQHNTQ